MKASIVETVAVPLIGAKNPARLYQASATPMRVVVRNVGGVAVFIAHNVSDLNNINSTGATYSLPAGQADVFVLAPGQGIFAAGNGGNGFVSIAASEAIPVDKHWMES